MKELHAYKKRALHIYTYQYIYIHTNTYIYIPIDVVENIKDMIIIQTIQQRIARAWVPLFFFFVYINEIACIVRANVRDKYTLRKDLCIHTRKTTHQHDKQRALQTCKRVLQTFKRALQIFKRALQTLKRALQTLTRVLDTPERTLLTLKSHYAPT